MTDMPQTPEGQPARRADEHVAPATPQGDTERLNQAGAADGSSVPLAAAPTGPAATPVEHRSFAAPGASFGSAATDTSQTGAYPAAAEPGAPVEKKRHITVPVIAALAVGALLGGAAGGGIAVLAGAGNDNSSLSSSASPNITVNRTENATTVTAVAAQASPAVATIAVSGANGSGTGSGVILSEDGYVLTNTHVVTLDGSAADAEVKVTLADGRIFDATIVGIDPIVDLAVIQLEGASGLPTIEWGDSSDLNVGDTAIAIGSPLGLNGTVTDGIVSALNRSITVASSAVPEAPSDDDSGDQGDQGDSPFDFWNFDIPGQQAPSGSSSSISLPVIQTDAAINPGNSGGALLNAAGELIGINVAIASAGSSSGQSGNIGVGFAVPSNLAQRVAQEIIENGSATHGLLGATVADATTAAEDAGIAGAYIDEVTPDGAAAAAGLQSGDIITEFNGIAITSQTDLTAQVRYLAAGAEAELTYVRGGDANTATVTLGQLQL